MKQSVLDVFPAFTARLEGARNWPSLNRKGWVTVAWGCLIDPFTLARHLPWLNDDTGEPATQSEVWRNWKRVKESRNLAHQGPEAAKRYSVIRLADETMRELVCERLRLNSAFVTSHWFPAFTDWPADAQLATMSIAWVLGASAFGDMPKLMRPAIEQAWLTCAEECFVPTVDNPALVPRNWANRKLFTKAATSEIPDEITGWP